MTSDARSAYEAIYAEWHAERRLASLHKTTAERLEAELVRLAEVEAQKRGRRFLGTLEPESIFGPKATE